MTLTTPRLRLEPFTVAHITPEYLAWLNDPVLMRFSEQRHKSHTFETALEHLDFCRLNHSWFWAIYFGSDMIGTLTAHGHSYGIVDMGILIGSEFGDCGYGLEAWTAALEYLRKQPHVRKVTAGTLAANLPMLKLLQRAGMQPDGRRTQHYVIDGQPVDVCYYAIWNPPRACDDLADLPPISQRDARRALEYRA